MIVKIQQTQQNIWTQSAIYMYDGLHVTTNDIFEQFYMSLIFFFLKW